MKHLIPLSIILLLLSGCGNSDSSNEQQTKAESDVQEKFIPVKTRKISTEIVPRIVEYTSTLQPFEEVYLAPSSPGKIDKINVEVGDHVEKGQVLILLDKTQLNQAQIQLRELETNYSRLKSLLETNSISRQQYDDVKAQLDVTRANVEYLEDNTIIKAPYSGVIAEKYYEDGEIYSGSPISEAGKAAIVLLQQVNKLKAIIDVSEKHYPELKSGMEVELTCETYPNEVFYGTVYKKYPSINPSSHTFQVEISIPNKDERLRPGMFSRAKLSLKEVEAILIPSIAVLKLQGANQRYIFINDNGKAKRISVELGDRFDDLVEVISDELTAGDELIVSGQGKLVDQAPIKVMN